MRKMVLIGVLLFALIAGGLAHGLVPHEHGHAHSSEETSIWSSLHSSLRHEDKKALYVLVESVVLYTVSLFAIGFSIQIASRSYASVIESSLAILRTPLRRGVLRYRVFT